jgi:hypothetical protein
MKDKVEQLLLWLINLSIYSLSYKIRILLS